MPKFKVPLHRTRRRASSESKSSERASGWVAVLERTNECTDERASESCSSRATERPRVNHRRTDNARTRLHTHACMRNAADECVAMAPARRHRLGQVSDKARSRQVLRGLSVCARRWLSDLRPRARLFVCPRASERGEAKRGKRERGLVSPAFFSPVTRDAEPV